MKNVITLIGCAVSALAMWSCAGSGVAESGFVHVSTTNDAQWTVATAPVESSAEAWTLSLDTAKKAQQIDGFGGCFNELGWTSLSLLSDADREAVMQELFAPGKGGNFSICRMPVAANDFSRQWYSYNEVTDDFGMYNFSIDNDRATLIPFIKNAKVYNPDIRIWASPWCPPTWMKHNDHYASNYNGDNNEAAYRNGLPKERVGYEGTDMFKVEPEYLKAYALYFKKFIQEYRKEGIQIFGVMPQNEFNSPQVFPSCCWTAKGLATFVGDYLGPAMAEEKVKVMFGTMERPNHLLVDTILQDPKASKYISAVGFQWAGRDAIGKIHEAYPDMPLYQTEQECGDGQNNWNGAVHSWNLLKHYMDNGVSVYDYWNISLLQGGISRWGWAQNSLVVVNPEDKTYRYTLEYYVMKHISHFVQHGAYNLKLSGDAAGNCLAFVNPDHSLVVLAAEKDGKDRTLTFEFGGKTHKIAVKANSFNTICLK